MRKNTLFAITLSFFVLMLSGCASKMVVDVLGKGSITNMGIIESSTYTKEAMNKPTYFSSEKIKNLAPNCFMGGVPVAYPVGNDFSGYILPTAKEFIYAENPKHSKRRKISFAFSCPKDKKPIQFIEQSDFDYYVGQEVILMRVYKDKTPIYFVRPFTNLMKGSAVP